MFARKPLVVPRPIIVTALVMHLLVIQHKLKGGKNDGFDGLTSDFILNGTDLLCQHLSTLFLLMLSHCIAPSSFCMSTMIPIPKGSGLMGGIKNYRGIALSSLLSKLFDTCIISSQFNRLQSNDL